VDHELYRSGARVGPYEIVSALGEGGTGAVYRARDTKLNREVAIKVLLPAVANDPERLARFQREAEVLASLNHPHIAAIYGLEDADGRKALVLELVEGPTLADRIAQGAMPLDEALPIARQIAEALDAAHDRGIVHRDLKPANIKVRPDGTVKVLAFAHHHDTGDDCRRDDPWHGRIHGPRTGAGQGHRHACGHLGLRVRAVRNAHRATCVSR